MKPGTHVRMRHTWHCDDGKPIFAGAEGIIKSVGTSIAQINWGGRVIATPLAYVDEIVEP